MSSTTKSATIFIWSVILLFFTTPLVAQDHDLETNTVASVRRSHSMLKHQGLLEMRANVVPAWEHLTRDLNTAQAAQLMKLANRLSFTVSIDSAGVLKVNHQVSGPQPDKTTAAKIEELAQGVELSITGFFMSWTPFMLTELIPEKPQSLVLKDHGTGYLLSYKEGSNDISVVITKDLAITELKSPAGSLKPTSVRTVNGYLLTAYEGRYQNTNLGELYVRAAIVSEEIGGMQLPRNVTISGTVKGSPVGFGFGFTNYELKTNSGLIK